MFPPDLSSKFFLGTDDGSSGAGGRKKAAVRVGSVYQISCPGRSFYTQVSLLYQQNDAVVWRLTPILSRFQKFALLSFLVANVYYKK